MKKYWIIVNGQPTGPFTPNEIKARPDFTPELPVWSSDMPDWSTAGQVDELAALLPQEAPAEAPAPAPQASAWVRPVIAAEIDGVKKPRTYIVWNIILIFLGNMICAAVGIICGMMSTRRWLAGNVEGAQKASNGAAWCIMTGIVLALVSLPFSMLMPYITDMF